MEHYTTKTFHYQPGDRVTANGYEGRIIREYSCRMYEVRLASGDICIDVCDIQPFHP